jgi:hypothetical protein
MEIRSLDRVVAVVVLGVGFAAASCSPATAVEGASIQAVLDPGGGGRMIVNSQTNPPDETWSWEACTTDLATCTPFAQGRIVETAGAPVPSVFRAVSSRGATALSPRWDGQVESVSSPSAMGTPQANELVVPIPGRWRGGWEGDVDWTQLAACEGPRDEGCTTLTDRHYVGGCPNGAAVIDPMFTGMYLRVADRRIPAHTLELAYGVSSPYGPDIWAAGPTVSVSVLGRIRAATGPPASGCGPSPLVRASISKKGVATVRCGLACLATLVARQGRRMAKMSRRLAGQPGNRRNVPAPRLRLPKRKLARFHPGRIHMALMVNGKRFAARTLLLRSPKS